MVRKAAVLMLMLACGGTKPAPPAPPVVTDAGVAVTDAEVGGDAGDEVELTSRSEDGIAAAGAAFAYIHAVSVRDWPGACALLRAQEKAKQAAKAGGSCPRGLEKQFDAARITALGTAATGSVRKRGKTLAVDITAPNQPQPIMVVYLQREDRLWLLVDVPDSEAF
jgi:hypothetical protein